MGSRAFNVPIRLAILEADTPAPGIKAKYQSYGGVFTHMFKRACAALPHPAPLESQLSLSFHNIVNDPTAYPDLETVDAVLITGSKYNAFDNDEWIVRLVQFTKRCLEGGRIRVIGVCYGHQIIGRALGAELGRNTRGWEVSVVEHELTEEGRKVFGMEKMSIHQMHRDAVLSFPPGVVQLAWTNVCANQAMYIPGRMISVQGHPEFTEEMVHEILDMRKYGGIVSDGLYEDGISRVANKQDGVAVAQAFLRFLHG
ncbi:putative class I glutamine amidotransferase [Xylaria castorea]|nr:putative class I glutamine amidotransferase [Xylaria castorea]